MKRQRSFHFAATLRNLVKNWFSPRRSASLRRGSSTRRYCFESLEGRAMLAADLGSITGLIYQDLNGNGFQGSEAVANATVNLFIDDGDGIFEPGAGAGNDGVAIATTMSDVNGDYEFNQLAAGSYWVEQPSQPGNVGSRLQVVRLVPITPTQAAE